MAGFLRLYNQKHNPPAETTESFAGKTVLITGTTSGLGLEAAKKLVILDASNLIITARTVEKGEKAKAEIQQHLRDHVKTTGAKSASNTSITVLPLDMSSMSDVEAFSTTLQNHLGRGTIDAAILNAGVNQRVHKYGPDGYEETLQVNVISTTLLAMLLLPLLIKSSETKGTPSHLTFVSSGTIMAVTQESIQSFLPSQSPLKDLSEESNFPPGKLGGSKVYARSKLMLEYAMRHIASLPAVYDSRTQRPKVIVNSTCPGLCRSDLGRNFTGSMFFRILLWIFYGIFARTASQGANSYISALTRGTDSQGVLWKDDKFYPVGEMLTSDRGKEFGDVVWEELKRILQSRRIESGLLA